MAKTAEKIMRKYNLQPLPVEGGYYLETYRSQDQIPKDLLSEHYDGDRAFSTAILYLLTQETRSALHRLLSDEIFHFYTGDPVELLQLFPDGSGKIVTLGSEALSGMEPQLVVPANTWQGSCLKAGGEFALLGTTVAPGFEFADYTGGDRTELLRDYPEFRDYIIKLTG